MKVNIEYKGGMQFSGITPSGHQMVWDTGPREAVTEGPTPMEGLLLAGAVCSAMDVVAILRKRRKEIEHLELQVEAEREETHPKVFKTYNIIYLIRGNGIVQTEVEKAIKLSQDRYCSILNMLKSDVKVKFKVEMLNG
jgi:putative redox protein